MFVTLCFSPIKVQNIYETTNFYEQNLIPNWGKKCNHTEQCAKDKKCDADKHECKDGKKDDKKCSKKECDKKPCCKKDAAKKGECNKKAKPVKK